MKLLPSLFLFIRLKLSFNALPVSASVPSMPHCRMTHDQLRIDKRFYFDFILMLYNIEELDDWKLTGGRSMLRM